MRTRVPLSPIATVACALLVAGFARVATAQTSMVPYFGKNNIHYDKFEWHIYTTDHFEIYYYPEIKQHLERVASYAESAYQQVSADLTMRSHRQTCQQQCSPEHVSSTLSNDVHQFIGNDDDLDDLLALNKLLNLVVV